jgi:hypothetical protein
MFRTLSAPFALFLLMASPAQAALHSRLGGLAYYDDVLDITWLTESRTGAGGIHDDGLNTTDGRMSWASAVLAVSALNAANHLGVNNWRLPDTLQPDPTCAGQFDFGPPAGIQSFGSGCTGSELGHLRNLDGISGSTPGPFLNVANDVYWSGTTVAFDSSKAWSFDLGPGTQNTSCKTCFFYYVWAVRDGDIQGPDSDGDGIGDSVDNCTQQSNPSQCDSDGDGYGNRCDGDMNNNGSTNAQDTTLYRQQLGQPSVAPTYNEADINCSGAVNAQDTTLYRQLLGSPPGPSGLVP